jgi:hypothetical protein
MLSRIFNKMNTHRARQGREEFLQEQQLLTHGQEHQYEQDQEHKRVSGGSGQLAAATKTTAWSIDD